MGDYLEYDGKQKGYKPFQVNKESIMANIGKKIVYLTTQNVDKYRGYFFPRYGVICGMKYSTVYLNDNNNTFDKRDLVDCGIEIDEIENTDNH
jgi:hypothetical protein